MPAIRGNKFVIVGGASLLGSNIGVQLLNAGAGEVLLVDNLALGSSSAVEDLIADERCSLIRGDMTRLRELLDPFDGAEGIFSVAGFLSGPMLANPWMGLDVNIRGIQNVLEAARVKGVRKVIFSSSIGVYGRVAQSNSETSPFDWESLPPAVILYSGSKIVGEGLCRMYQQHHGVDTVALRYSNLYGEKQHKRAVDATRIVNAWERIRMGQRPVIQGSGEQVTDFIYIGDVARANLLAMESGATGCYNIASGEDVTFNELNRALLAACDSNLEPVYESDSNLNANPVVSRMKLSRSAARDAFGWEPQVDIYEGMRRLVTWLDAERAAGRS